MHLEVFRPAHWFAPGGLGDPDGDLLPGGIGRLQRFQHPTTNTERDHAFKNTSGIVFVDHGSHGTTL